MAVTSWKDLWDYMTDKAQAIGTTRVMSPNDFLNGMVDDYEKLTPCIRCGSRRQEALDIRGHESNQVLAQRIVCRACGQIIGEVDRRDALRNKLERGEVLVKDLAAIQRDLGE